MKYVNNAFVVPPTDPRVADWPLMASPIPVATILLAYLAFILYLGPMYMRNRPPYSLHKVMIFYNVFVVFASAAVFYGVSYIIKIIIEDYNR